MTAWVFIAGLFILGVAVIGAALIVTAGLSAQGSGASGGRDPVSPMSQPTLAFFTEFDTADYLGVSVKELDYMRENGMLDGSFVAVTSLEKTGEEDFYDFEDGIEVVRKRPIFSSITRYLFNRALLDEKMLELIKSGTSINTAEKRYADSSRPRRRGAQQPEPSRQPAKQDSPPEPPKPSKPPRQPSKIHVSVLNNEDGTVEPLLPRDDDLDEDDLPEAVPGGTFEDDDDVPPEKIERLLSDIPYDDDDED